MSEAKVDHHGSKEKNLSELCGSKCCSCLRITYIFFHFIYWRAVSITKHYVTMACHFCGFDPKTRLQPTSSIICTCIKLDTLHAPFAFASDASLSLVSCGTRWGEQLCPAFYKLADLHQETNIFFSPSLLQTHQYKEYCANPIQRNLPWNGSCMDTSMLSVSCEEAGNQNLHVRCAGFNGVTLSKTVRHLLMKKWY